MATDFPRPTTLAQFRAALERAETSQRDLTQELDTTRKTNAQLSKELQAAQLRATQQEQQLNALKTASQAELAKAEQETVALNQQLLAALAKAEQAQADQVAAEAQAGQRLTEAGELLNRMKLAAAAAADREVKRETELAHLRHQLQQAQAALEAPEAEPDTRDQLTRLRQQVDGLVAENRLMAQARELLAHDQQLLAATIEGHPAVLAKAVEQARAETQQLNAQEMGRLQEAVRLGQARVATLSAQLQTAGQLEVLAPDQVGALLSGFLQQVEGGMPNLKLSEGELKLKLGLARTGQTQGFVILQPGATTDAQALTVHEVALKFDRTGALAPLQAKP